MPRTLIQSERLLFCPSSPYAAEGLLFILSPHLACFAVLSMEKNCIWTSFSDGL